jgi:hypothetical protein
VIISGTWIFFQFFFSFSFRRESLSLFFRYLFTSFLYIMTTTVAF